MEINQTRHTALHWAWETHPNRFNVADKPTPEDVIERAEKFMEFLIK
jgi:hypothetical protein